MAPADVLKNLKKQRSRNTEPLFFASYALPRACLFSRDETKDFITRGWVNCYSEIVLDGYPNDNILLCVNVKNLFIEIDTIK